MSSTADIDDVHEQINSLKSLREKTQALLGCKASLTQKSESLELKRNLLEEVSAERHRLNKEKKILLEMLQSVQGDLDAIVEIETSLTNENEELTKSVEHIRTRDYEPLHEQVNSMRRRAGLPDLPHLQRELEARLAKKLEEKRQQWQQHGVGVTPIPSQPISSDSIPGTSVNSGTARRRAAPATQRGRPKKRRP